MKKISLLSLVKEISARPDYERGTPVYFVTRHESRRGLPTADEDVPQECANGMEIVFALDRHRRVLGMEVYPIIW
ncbi:MAG: hypothetical protein AMXMBFR61_04370 [Fimbriimonadales bacterium]